MTRPASVAVALGALAALAACHPRAPVPRTIEGDWALARDAATRRAVLYDGFKHRATGTATHLSLAVREARARRLAEWLGWTPLELEARLAEERAAAASGEEFLLSFFTADTRSNDLDAPRSVWRVAATIDGVDVVSSRITSVDNDATTVGLFPFVGHFDVAYRVFLPKHPSGALDGRPFVLQIASTLGKVTLDYGAPVKRPVNAPWQPVPAP